MFNPDFQLMQNIQGMNSRSLSGTQPSVEKTHH